MGFEHAEIERGLIVIEREGEAIEEDEHVVLMLEEALEQYACWGLWASTAYGRTQRGWGRRIGGHPWQSSSW